MILTTKYGLKVPEDTDLADLKVFVGDNMTILDGHTHDYATLTNIPSTFTPPIASTTVIGGGLLGNGLSVSGNYIFVKTNSSLGTAINTTGAYEVMIDRTVVDTWYQPRYTTGTGVPTTIPTSVGLLFVDTTNRNAYISTGTTATTDWEQIDFTSAGGGTWGSITGTLANQTDLQTALNDKANLVSPNFTGTPMINGNEILSQSASAGSYNPLFIWSGTQAEYDAIATKDPTTLYFISG